MEKVLRRKGNYFAVPESKCFALYFGCIIEGKLEVSFITNFDYLEDFDYWVDQAEEEFAYMLEEVN
jgi:hypothetical protein